MENKNYQPIVYVVKEYLEKNCVGKENIQNYNTIVSNLVLRDGTRIYDNATKKMFYGKFKKIIQTLRNDFDRIICSTSKGYYLPTSENEESYYNVNKCVTLLKTCLAQGVDSRVFYKVLNENPSNTTPDGQEKLKLTPYAKEVVTRYTKND